MTPNHRSPLRRARLGMFGCFTTSGLVMGAWPASIPEMDARVGLGEARLAIVLLVLEVCSLLAMPLAGRLCDRATSRAVLRWTGPAAQLLLIAPALAPTYPVLVATVGAYGIGLGFANVALNVQTVELERRHGRPVISSFHAFWALGAAAAGALGVAALSVGIPAPVLLSGTGFVGAVLFAACTRPLLPPPAVPGGPSGAAPRRLGFALLALAAVVAFSTDFIEAGATGWSNLHAARVLGADPALAPLALTLFMAAMTFFRLIGDPLRARLGPGPSMLTAGAVVTLGYALVLTSPSLGGLPLAWTGWVLAGAGSAVLVPVLFSAIGNAGGTASDLAAVSMCGSAAYLTCPAVIGPLADAAGLNMALLAPTALAVAVAVAGPLAVARLGCRASLPEAVAAAPEARV